VVVLIPGVALAQTNQLPSDPDADSPSGTVYEIPLEKARKDAAPKRSDGDTSVGSGSRGNGSQDGGTGSTSSPDSAAGAGVAGRESLYRSENNFGSSSQIPGVDDRRKQARTRSADGSTKATDGTSPTSQERAIANVGATSQAAASGPSNAVVIALLVLLLAVGTIVGVAASRRRRDSSTP
jgi:hypothetical protein